LYAVAPFTLFQNTVTLPTPLLAPIDGAEA
jgi:hypothetical protein